MQDASRFGYVWPLDMIGHTLAVPAFPLKVNCALNVHWKAKLTRKEFRNFTVTAHHFPGYRSTLHHKGQEFADTIEKLCIQPQVFGQPAEHVAETGGINE